MVPVVLQVLPRPAHGGRRAPDRAVGALCRRDRQVEEQSDLEGKSLNCGVSGDLSSVLPGGEGGGGL